MKRAAFVLLVWLTASAIRAAGYNLIQARAFAGYNLAGESTTEQPGRRVQIVYVSSRSCVPCRLFESQQIPRMIAAGWTFGGPDDATSHFRRVDSATRPDLVRRFGVDTVPAFVRIIDGRPAGVVVGYRTAEQLNQFYRGDK